MHARPLLATLLLLLLAGCDARGPAEPEPETPDPTVQVRTVQSSPGPCLEGWCAYLIIVATTHRTTGEPVAAELKLNGDGRYLPSHATTLPEAETNIEWDFPHRNGTYSLSVCPKGGSGEQCTSYQASVAR
jgi:hypothetical protein